MPVIGRNNDISVLPLSVRTRNCLHKEQIHTIGAMLDYPAEDLLSIRNMGAKSVAEVRHWIQVLLEELDGYTLVDYQESPPLNTETQEIAFVDHNGAIAQDLPIAATPLSIRAKNALKNGGVEYVSQLVNFSEAELLSFKNMGRKSVDEILAYVAKVEVTYRTGVKESPAQLPEECQEIILQMVRCFGQETITWEQKLIAVMNAHPDSCGETLIYYLYAIPFTRATAKATILRLIEESGDEISKTSLEEQMPQHLGNTTILEELLLELETASAVEIGDVMIHRQHLSIVQFVAQLKDMRQREVLEARLAGITLQEIGDSNGGISRERVRQISGKGLCKRPRLKEDQYAYLYDNYDFSEADFSLAFDEPKETYNYLEMVSTKSRSKRKPIEDLLTDASVPITLRRKAEKAVYKQYITIDGVRVKKQRTDLVKYFVKTLCKTLTKFDDFVEFYNSQLEELGLAGDPSLCIESRTYENILNGCDYVLWNQWRSFRYYNIPEHDFEELLNTIDFASLNNTEISSLKLFRDYPKLMVQYDIRDEYELHNLLKKIWKDNTVKLNFRRMPTIVIGVPNRDEQVLSLLIQYAPISAEGLAAKYEDIYGIKAASALANYFSGLDAYYYNGIYSIASDNLPQNHFERMKTVLTEMFYTISDVKRIYLREFPDANTANINPYTLKTIGFRVYSGYVIHNTYSSAADYFSSLLTTDDIVDARDISRSIQNVVSYSSALYKLREDYEIVEFSPLQYINIRRLNHAGIEKNDLLNYCQAVADFYEKGAYFTIASLRKAGFVHTLDDLGFEEWFYSSVLLEDREHFSYQRIGGTRVFLRGKSNATLGEMLAWILEQCQKIDLYDLIDLLRERYGVVLPKEKLIEILRGTNLYYDTIMESVYIDYDTYFEEI